MRKLSLELSEADRLKLEKGYRNGASHNYRIRCKAILLLADGKTGLQVAELLDVTTPTVYKWVSRFRT